MTKNIAVIHATVPRKEVDIINYLKDKKIQNTISIEITREFVVKHQAYADVLIFVEEKMEEKQCQ